MDSGSRVRWSGIMAASNLTLNPYRPVILRDTREDGLRVNPHAQLEIAVTPGLLYRQLHLTGYLETSIVWDARGTREFVSLQGRKVAQKTSLWYVPRFDFEIATLGDPLAATIDVQVAWLVFVSGFRLRIDGQTVYAEGRWRSRQPHGRGT